jgi:hypothetical protein
VLYFTINLYVEPDIRQDIRYPVLLDIRYPAFKLTVYPAKLAGYPGKSVSGASLESKLVTIGTGTY